MMTPRLPHRCSSRMNESRDQPVFDDFAQLMERYLEDLRAGHESNDTVYVDRYPQWREEIRELFPLLRELEHRGDATTAKPMVNPGPRPSDVLGAYQIVREIGRGGMGVVYEAHSLQLDRRVALKILTDPGGERKNTLARFQLEARAAGKLHHTNIVPVFDSGVGNGTHFYAMQYIEGKSLDAVITELRRLLHAPPEKADSNHWGPRSSLSHGNSSEWSNLGQQDEGYFQRVGRVGVQVADALAHAHAHGVLHRDIKPANLLLDTSGTVWVTDFGLASRDDLHLTHSGDIVGTIRYMAPERFRGSADARSDVFSLGLTLYELCTLQPAFSAADRGELLRQVMHTSPAPLRRINYHVPRDLETIIVKAIASEPANRYESAQAMSADLRRFINGIPVQARRISTAERLWRWSKRNRATAAFLVTLALLAVTIVISSLWYGYQSRRFADRLGMENRKTLEAARSAREAAEEARAMAAKAQSATRASDGHRFWSHYRTGQALRDTRLPGQQDLALNELWSAMDVLPSLGLDSGAQRRRELAVRSESIAALANWEVREQARWMAPDKNLNFAITPDGDLRLVIMPDGSVETQTTRTGRTVRSLSHSIPCVDLMVASNGRALITLHEDNSDDGPRELLVRNVETGDELWRIPAQSACLGGFALSPDGNMLAVTYVSEIALYQLETGAEVHRLSMPGISVAGKGNRTLLAFANDNASLLLVPISERDQVIQCSLDSGETAVLQEFDAAIQALAWDENQSRLAVGTGTRIQLWNPQAEPESIIQLHHHTDQVFELQFGFDGHSIVSSGWDNTVRIFDLRLDREVIQVRGQRMTGAGLLSQSVPSLLLTSNIHGDCRVQIPVPPAAVTGVAFQPLERPQKLAFMPGRSHYCAFLSQRGVVFYDHQEQEFRGELLAPGVYDFVFQPDGKALFTSGEDGVRCWQLTLSADGKVAYAPGETICTLPGRYLDLDHSGERLVFRLEGGKALVLSLDGSPPTEIGPHERMNHARFDPTGTLIVTTTWRGNGVRVWSAEGTEKRSWGENSSTAYFAFSPQGDQIAISTSDAVQILKFPSMETVTSIDRESPVGPFGQVDWSPDGAILATAYTGSQPQLIECQTGNTVAVLESGESERTGVIRFSDDNRFLAITYQTGIRIWDLDSLRNRLRELEMDW